MGSTGCGEVATRRKSCDAYLVYINSPPYCIFTDKFYCLLNVLQRANCFIYHGRIIRKAIFQHKWSQSSREVVDLFSNEIQVTKNTPPAYLTHAADDKVVDVDNSIAYFEKLRHQNVDVEMHIYPKGGHGFIFRQKGWMDPLIQWMKNNKWINS